ncbi:26S proteasome regulatory subunit 4 homolog isoform X2 [Humulus lupulus]|uniref:26S proteasome regulatory subunit 4 homolog isoform X2 n=1 Tax=Humulus lupulus TaxID=3486 RepID=UPI002B415BB0|nr:26S proteasome regulatory subunit 4 homolog isoform X2 [Humulus lupulus]
MIIAQHIQRSFKLIAQSARQRYDAHSWGLEQLNQLGGFDSRGDAKLILDPASASPRGRIERRIALPRPLSDIKARRRIFRIHASRMPLAVDVNLEKFVRSEDDFSGADVKAIFTEARLIANGDLRIKTIQADFEEAKDKVMSNKKKWVPEAFIKFNGRDVNGAGLPHPASAPPRPGNILPRPASPRLVSWSGAGSPAPA